MSVPLLSRGMFAQLRWWSASQWWTLVATAAVMVVGIGEVGQTIPPTSGNRSTPIEWWNYATLLASSLLIGMIAATFVTPAGRRLAAAGGSGIAGTVAAIVMSCPFCNPLAIPLLGVGGALAFLRGYRGWLALASVLVLAATLLLRLRAVLSCGIRSRPSPGRRAPLATR